MSKHDRRLIETAIVAFASDHNRRPESLRELVKARLLGSRVTLDPWGHAYRETWTDQLLTLTSNGEDDVANTPDDVSVELHIGAN